MGKRLWLQQYAISYADIDTYYAIKRRIIELASAALSQRANKGQNMARGRGKMHVIRRNTVFTNMPLLTLHMQLRGVNWITLIASSSISSVVSQQANKGQNMAPGRGTMFHSRQTAGGFSIYFNYCTLRRWGGAGFKGRLLISISIMARRPAGGTKWTTLTKLQDALSFQQTCSYLWIPSSSNFRETIV